MSYTYEQFSDGQVLTHTNMNNITNGIKENSEKIASLESAINNGKLYTTSTVTTTGGMYTNGSGTSNWSWIVHKHSDGLCECYGSGYFYASGASFSSVIKGPSINLPITFKETPYISCLATDPGRDDTYIWFTFPSATVSSTGKVHYIGSTHDDIVTCKFHVVGKWK